MRDSIFLILKGLLIGLGKVIPGVSGSLIAVGLGVYEKAIHAIGHFFSNVKEHIVFLGTMALGVLIAIALGSKIIVLCLEFFYIPTMLLFIGFIVGILPGIYKKCNYNRKKVPWIFLLSFLFIFFLNLITGFDTFYPDFTLPSYLKIMGLGFLDAATMIIPGISGTAIFMMLGCYPFILNLFGDMISIPSIIHNFPFILFFTIGLGIGIILVTIIVDFLFRNYRSFMYQLVLGFTASSVFILLEKTLTNHISLFHLICGLFLFIIGMKISFHLNTE